MSDEWKYKKKNGKVNKRDWGGLMGVVGCWIVGLFECWNTGRLEKRNHLLKAASEDHEKNVLIEGCSMFDVGYWQVAESLEFRYHTQN